VRTGVFVSGTLAMFAFVGNRDSIRSADPKYCHPQMGGWKDVTMKRFAGGLRESGIHKSLDITIDFPDGLAPDQSRNVCITWMRSFGWRAKSSSSRSGFPMEPRNFDIITLVRPEPPVPIWMPTGISSSSATAE